MRGAVLSARAIGGVTGGAKSPARPEPTPLGSVAALPAQAQADGLWQQVKAYGREQQQAETRAAAAAAAQAEADRVAAEVSAAEQTAAEAARQEEAAPPRHVVDLPVRARP
jgi:hypothetical protein